MSEDFDLKSSAQIIDNPPKKIGIIKKKLGTGRLQARQQNSEIPTIPNITMHNFQQFTHGKND